MCLHFYVKSIAELTNFLSVCNLKVMLMNPEWSECRESVIELKEEPLCSEVFPQFLRYLYVGQIRISLQTVMPMLALADKYNIRVS